MLNKFSSAARKINRVIAKINPNNLVNPDLTGSLLNIQIPSTTKYQSKTRQTIFSTIVNEATQTVLTSSLLNIDLPSSQSFQSQTRSNPNPITIVNNTNTINDFHAQIFDYSARYVQRNIDTFDNNTNTLTIHSASLDYGTEGASPNNFEVLVFGLHIPGNYTIKEVGNNVVITLNEEYIDYDNVTINDIYVMGKLKE